MNLKRFIYTAALLIVYTSAFAQLKVDNAGRVGMGTNWPNPGYKCHIKGNLLLTTYPNIPFYEFQFKVGNGWPGTEIGSTADKVAFWSTWVSYHKLYAEQYYKMSDASLKSNLAPINNPVTKLMTLKPYIYDLRDRAITGEGDSIEGTLRQYGFISQEVEETLPEIKITEDGNDGKLLDYDQIIPLLVAGIQEQQKQLSALEAQVASMMLTTESSDSSSTQRTAAPSNETSQLLSTDPNPFSTSTVIGYSLGSKVNKAMIKVWDMQGIERKAFNLSPEQGKNQVTLNASDLPISGTYNCALIVEGKIVDVRQLICNR